MTDYIDATLKMPKALYNKQIAYDYETHDVAMYLDSELVGFARDPDEAEATLDQLVLELVGGQYFADRQVAPSFALPAAPTVENNARTPDTFTSPDTSTVAGREDAALLQTPNLIRRWEAAIAKARASTSPIEQREWVEHAISITELLVSPSVCDCGVALNDGRCDDCLNKQEQLTADRARFGAMALDIDPAIGF